MNPHETSTSACGRGCEACGPSVWFPWCFPKCVLYLPGKTNALASAIRTCGRSRSSSTRTVTEKAQALRALLLMACEQSQGYAYRTPLADSIFISHWKSSLNILSIVVRMEITTLLNRLRTKLKTPKFDRLLRPDEQDFLALRFCHSS